MAKNSGSLATERDVPDEARDMAEKEESKIQWSLWSIVVTILALYFALWRLHSISAIQALFTGSPATTIFFCRRVLKLQPFESAFLGVVAGAVVGGCIGFFDAYFTVDEELGSAGWKIVTLISAILGGAIGLASAIVYGICVGVQQWRRRPSVGPD